MIKLNKKTCFYSWGAEDVIEGHLPFTGSQMRDLQEDLKEKNVFVIDLNPKTGWIRVPETAAAKSVLRSAILAFEAKQDK